MGKNKKRANKSQDKVPPASEKQCSEPVNDCRSSQPVNESKNDGESGRFHEEMSGVNKNKEVCTNTDKLNLKHDPPECNQDELTHLKNKCGAVKAQLNATLKKYEDEKQKKEKLYEENQDLKSKLSLLERELLAAKKQIQEFKRRNSQHQKSSEVENMDVEIPKDNVYDQEEQQTSLDFPREKKEDSWVQYNRQGAREEACSIMVQDTEMVDSFKGEESDKKQSYVADNWYDDIESGSSSQPSDNSSVPAASGNDTRCQKRRGSDTGPKRNERHQRQPPYRNEEQPPCRNEGQHHVPHQLHRNEDQRYGPHQLRRNEDQHNGPHQWPNRGRGGGRGNRDDRGQNYGRGMDDRGDHGQNYNNIENHHDRYDNRMRTTDELPVVTEIFGDLFEAPRDCSLAHCVAEDMRMGSGIAVTFRQKYKCVDELLQQRKRQGQVAVLEHEGRYIYYLVTKRESTGKPTMETLERSLVAMRDHVTAKQVKKIAMPRIGCGLDRLEWNKVKPLIEEIFEGTGAQITVYNYNEDKAESSKYKPTSNVRLKNAEKPVAEIEPETAILCLCAADGSVDSTFELLDRKFRIMTQYQKMDKQLGNILDILNRNYLIILLIVKEEKDSPLSFLALGNCVRQACKVIEKHKYYYVAVESYDDKNEQFLFERVITVIKNYLDTKWEKELWLCCPKTVSWK